MILLTSFEAKNFINRLTDIENLIINDLKNKELK